MDYENGGGLKMEGHIHPGNVGDDEFSISEILTIIKNHLLLIILLPVSLGIISFVYSKLLPPVYSASSKVLVLLADPSPDSQTVDLRPEPLDLETYKEIALSQRILRKIYNHTLDKTSIQELRQRFSVRYIEGRKSGILFLAVESNDPQNAASEANAWAEALLDWEKDRSLGTLLDEKKRYAHSLRPSTTNCRFSIPTLTPIVTLH